MQSATGFSGDMLAGAGIGYGIYDTVKTYKDFEKQMSAVGAISGASSSQMEMLTQKAREMGTITSFSATEAGKAFEYMATEGWKTDQMMNGILSINRAQIIRENRQAELETGAGITGSILGATIGAGLGSLVGSLGTAIGGTIGGMIGQALGVKIGEEGAANETEQTQSDYFGFNESSPILKLGDSAKRRAADIEENARREYSALTGLDSAKCRLLDLQEQSTQTQLDRFKKIDSTLGASSPFKYDSMLNATQDYYAQQREHMTNNSKSELLQNPLDVLDSTCVS